MGGYERARAEFEWKIPPRFNMGVHSVDAWAEKDPERTAIIDVGEGEARRYSFEALRAASNQLAHHLKALGIARGDRVALFAPQRFEIAVSHIAIYKLGAIAVPLFALFGPDALVHRLSDSETRLILTDHEGRAKLESLRAELPRLEHVIALDGLLETIRSEPTSFDAVDTAAEDPALLMYTSGTTGSSKGALLPHRTLLAHLPSMRMSHNGFPQLEDCLWTPADWAWLGGLLDVLLPGLYCGVPVVAKRFAKFGAKEAFQLMSEQGIRNTFLPPTALKMLRGYGTPPAAYPLALRSVASGGESLGDELLAWGREVLGVTINEFYGQTECGAVISSCSEWFDKPPASIGRAVLGHEVVVLADDAEVPAPAGTEGEIAIRSPDPVMLLEYWKNPNATREKYRGPWLLTGDRGTIDAEGFIRFVGRNDDVIKSAGYRIGPSEVEDCLLRHDAVELVGVIGIPDPTRNQAVGAFIVLSDGKEGSDALVAELQDHVRQRLGAHQYPRHVFFTSALPMTATGKILRRELRLMARDRMRGDHHA